ncbi:MAG TPA: DUF721 domain-containing protein [Edaphocola sp.]|nr:DUF721 domain-containing protein [Edaphocola sp.]
MAQVSIGEALQRLLKSNKWDSRINAIQIVDKWETIMGKTIAKYTDKVELKNGTLFIHTAVAPLKQELHAGKAQIIERVNAYFKSELVKSVVIK